MPDICDLVLDDHATFRRRFAELDLKRGDDGVGELWQPLAELLELHAAAEEAVFYPCLVETGTRGRDETGESIDDHNKIRDAVFAANRATPGTEAWWSAVDTARAENSDHMAEEERGAIADLRQHADDATREQLGTRWISYRDEHAGLRGVEVRDKDPQEYLRNPG